MPKKVSYCLNYKLIKVGTIIANLWIKKQPEKLRNLPIITKSRHYGAMSQKQSVWFPEPIIFPFVNDIT